MSTLGRLLRDHRESARLTQEELAERAGLSARTVSDIERGVRGRAYADTASRLAVALRLTDPERAAFLEVARGRGAKLGTEPASLRVPRPLTALLGRERELAELIRALGSGGTRLVTVTGLGGVGKTRLALAAAVELEVLFPGRVHVLAIPPNQAPHLLIAALARSLGVPQRVTAYALGAYLADSSTLVVLDAFEHVLQAAREVEALLGAAPGLRVLATSRERLRLTGEQELTLGALPVPERSDPDWLAAPAARLFMARARAVRPDLHADPEVIIDICHQVSGLPLALELAAARVRHLPLTALRDRLLGGIGDLTDSRPGVPGRQQSMEQTLAWSTASLTVEESLLLRVAALFPGGIRLDAAESLCGNEVDVVGAVSGLVDKSLMFLDRSAADRGVPRWRMFDVVRQFVQGHPAPTGTADYRRAFLRYFLRLLGEVDKDVGRELEWFDVLTAEEANLQTALTWAAEAGEADTLLRLCGGIWQFWQARGELTEGRRWLEAGLSLHPPATSEATMTALWGVGWLAYHQADEAGAEASAVALDRLARQHKDARAYRNALTLRGMVAISRDDPAEAVALLEEALQVARGLERSWLLATSLLNLGLGRLSAGDTVGAREVIGEALRLYQGVGDRRFHARCLGYLGLAAVIEEDPIRARALFTQSLTAFHELAEPEGMAEGLVGLAAVDAMTGRLMRAAALAGAGERIRESYAGRELPLDQRTTGHHLTAAEHLLGAEAWLRAWAEGRNLTPADAILLATDDPVHRDDDDATGFRA